MSKQLKLSLLLLNLLFFAWNLVAQDNECINFSDHIAQGTYGRASNATPGSLLFTDDSVSVRLQRFQYANGTTDFVNAIISDDPIFSGNTTRLLQDEYIFPSNINLQFDFTRLPNPVKQVCVNFIDGGGVENISVNGEPIKVIQNFAAINGQEIAPGVKANVQLVNALDLPAGVLCLTGNIKTLLIGGQELALDELCYRTENDQEDTCSIRSLSIKPTPCSASAGRYFLILNFEAEHTSDSFALWLNGNEIRRFTKRDLPLELGPFFGIINDTLRYKVFDLRNPACKAELKLQGVRCSGDNPPVDSCNIRNLRTEVLGCNPNGTFNLKLNFDRIVSSARDSFAVFYRGETLGKFATTQLPITLSSLRNDNSTRLGNIKICLLLPQRECCLETTFQLPNCTNTDTCTLRNGRTSELECIADNKYRVTINLDQNYPGRNFYVKTTGGFTEVFPYASLPLRVALPRTANNKDTITICDQRQPSCCIKLPLQLPCTNTDTCTLRNGRFSNLECIPENKYRVSINFDHGAGENFTVKSQGGFEGAFSYTALPLRLALPRTNTGKDVLTICDKRNPNCCTKIEIQLPCRDTMVNTCMIRNLQAQPVECANGKFKLRISFQSQNTGGSGYFIFVDGRIFGPFRYNQPLPVLGPFEAIENNIYDILMIDIDRPSCYDYLEVRAVQCQNIDTCKINNLRVRALPCDTAGKFFVILRFEKENPSSDSFNIRGNGRNYGNFSYALDSIKLGPFVGDGRTALEFIVSDLRNAACKNVATLAPVSCGVRIWPGDANTDNVVNHIDLLNIGLAYGARGPARQSRGISWQEASSDRWERNFANGDNFANADCNGDGVVNINDRAAIVQNFGLTHGPIEPAPVLPGTNLAPPIFVDLPDTQGLPNGLAFSAPVILGSQTNYLQSIYGVAFTIEFDPAIIDPASIQVTFPKSWFGVENDNLITFNRIDARQGLIYIAISKIDQRNAAGFGAVAMISGIIDDIAGRHISTIKIKNAQGIDLQQNIIPLNSKDEQVVIKSNESEVGLLDLRRSLRLLPNPATDQVQIYTKYNVNINSIEILDANGRPLRAAAHNTDRVSLEGLPQGVYILRIQIGEYIVNERIIKM